MQPETKRYIAYLSLFPLLGVFHLMLMILGQVNFPEIILFGTVYTELEQFRWFGAPSLGNLIEIIFAEIAGFFGLMVLVVARGYGKFQSERLIVKYTAYFYGASVLMYLFFPRMSA
jgi:hypothetical protein